MAFTDVEGFVSKVKQGGKGFVVEERWTTKDGKDGSKKWQVWFDDLTTLELESKVKVHGQYGDKVASFEKDGDTLHYTERSLNHAELRESKESSASHVPVQEQEAPAWSANDESTPF